MAADAARCPAPPRLPAPRPSDRKAKKAEAKKAGAAKKATGSVKSVASVGSLSEVENAAANGANAGATTASTVAAALEEFQLNDRSTTGVLTSHPQSRDIHFESFTLLYHGHELLTDATLELNYGR